MGSTLQPDGHSLPPESYLWFKTFHIIGVVVWFAELFYLVRLFIHVEAAEQEQPIQQHSNSNTA